DTLSFFVSRSLCKDCDNEQQIPRRRKAGVNWLPKKELQNFFLAEAADAQVVFTRRADSRLVSRRGARRSTRARLESSLSNFPHRAGALRGPRRFGHSAGSLRPRTA